MVPGEELVAVAVESPAGACTLLYRSDVEAELSA